MDVVGLPASAAGLYPHEFSSGQHQWIATTRALDPRPRMIVLDEPVTAPDVSIRFQVLSPLSDIHAEFGLTYRVTALNLATAQRSTHSQVASSIRAARMQCRCAVPFRPPRRETTIRLAAIS